MEEITPRDRQRYFTCLHVHSIIEVAKKYVEELDLQLWLNFPNSVAVAYGKEVEVKKVKQAIYKALQQ